MTNYLGKKEPGGQDDYANLIKTVESSVASDDRAVSELVD